MESDFYFSYFLSKVLLGIISQGHGNNGLLTDLPLQKAK